MHLSVPSRLPDNAARDKTAVSRQEKAFGHDNYSLLWCYAGRGVDLVAISALSLSLSKSHDLPRNKRHKDNKENADGETQQVG